jgi:hypothetical protein
MSLFGTPKLILPNRNDKRDMDRFRELVGTMLSEGRYDGTLIRDGKVIDEFSDKNLITNEGLTATLNIMLGGGTQITTWYIALFTGNYTPVATDTAASLPGNSTEATGYTGGSRPQFQPAAAASQSITNSASKASYTFNATQTIYGAFMVSSGVISGTSGTSFSAALFGTSKNVVNADMLLLTYSLGATSS